MKKIKRELFLNIFSNAVVALVIVFVFAFTLTSPTGLVSTAGKNYEPYYNGNRQYKKVSLMFNVYQNTKIVEDILGVLENHNAKATFFVGGCWADDNADCLNKIVGQGHEVGNHGYFHKDHDKLDYEQNKQEIYLTETVVTALCGEKTTLFAPPSGAFNKSTLEVCLDLDYKVIMWSKDTIDWRDKNSALVKKRATENLENGDLILMHPTEHTLSALDDILSYYESVGFTAVTVSENIAE